MSNQPKDYLKHLPSPEQLSAAYARLSQASTAVAVATLAVWDRRHALEKECAAVITSGALNDKTKYPNEAAREAGLRMLTEASADMLHEAEVSLKQNQIDLREAEIERDRLESMMKLIMWMDEPRYFELPANGRRTPPAGPPLTDDLIKDQEGYIRAMAAGGILPPDSMPLDDKPPSA